MRADLLLILTDVTGVLTDFGTPAAALVTAATPDSLAPMPFPAGSMGPKVEAVSAFVRATGHRAAIGPLDDVESIVGGTAGTQVTADRPLVHEP
ncbi:hypothetical protein [Frondihabitans sp. PAMC 28766]|uniref:hypothetical protein n=1 Tax=Frondihabitans sp. PAMC 28766 TaxID=1795630 RepID=UPI0035181E58